MRLSPVSVSNRDIDHLEQAQAFEAQIPLSRRKKLGQYFTGLPLGKVLAHLAVDSTTATVLDPMSGHGDLLDATHRAAAESGVSLLQLEGIEIEPTTAAFCSSRISNAVQESATVTPRVLVGSAFDPRIIHSLSIRAYDLVITNPPYVRYQTLSGTEQSTSEVRKGLSFIAEALCDPVERDDWQALIDGYSGLSDLSIPAWLLASMLVKPGGKLAMVIPSTWRSREYADVVRYLLLRFFEVNLIIEDEQPGWFLNALVRTQLLVARRLTPGQTSSHLSERSSWTTASWITVGRSASSNNSLLGNAFESPNPELAFRKWIDDGKSINHPGISSRQFDQEQEWNTVRHLCNRRRWFRHIEAKSNTAPLFGDLRSVPTAPIPESLIDLFSGTSVAKLLFLEDIGIALGQGLRTGCNKFFYVTLLPGQPGRNQPVRVSSFFDSLTFSFPAEVLKPALRTQKELDIVRKGQVPPSRVLSLVGWFLPEDASTEEFKSESARIMSDELADFVRQAAIRPLDDTGKTIPTLSAVRTNCRKHPSNPTLERTWYMLPDFAQRHSPDICIPRVNHNGPSVVVNPERRLLVDANFSSLWSPTQRWTAHAMKALLTSSWSQLCMEALGTTLGGGALKLEAAQLRRLPVPVTSSAQRDTLDRLGRVQDGSVQTAIDDVVFQALLPSADDATRDHLRQTAETRMAQMRSARMGVRQ